MYGGVVKIMVTFLGALNTRCRAIFRIQKGTIILTATHIAPFGYDLFSD